MRYFLIIILLTGCGREGDSVMEPVFEASLVPSMERYLAIAPNRGRMDLLASVTYAPLSAGGYCTQDEEGYWHIAVNAVMREKAQIFRDVILAHEMGHCVHGLTHTEDPESLMYGGSFHITRDQDKWEAELDNKIRSLFP
jgi:Zn-dependent peptidase ImmA (M78 family)